MTNATYMEAAFEPAVRHYRDVVVSATFGHLRPKAGAVYAGSILFARCQWGYDHLLRADFEGLPDSPWLYEDLVEFVSETLDDQGDAEGSVFLWTGTYARKKLRKKGEWRAVFNGVVKPAQPKGA